MASSRRCSLFWAYIIQKFILFSAYALSPLLIGFMAIRPLRSVGGRYLMNIVGVLLWPLGWAVAALITQGILDFMTDPSFKFIDPTASFYSLQATVGVAVVAFWIVFSTISAPLVIQKVLSHGNSRAASSSPERSAVSSRPPPPPLALPPSRPPPAFRSSLRVRPAWPRF